MGRVVVGSLGAVLLIACGPGAPAGTSEGGVATTGAGPTSGGVVTTGGSTGASTGTSAGTSTATSAATTSGGETTDAGGPATTGEVSTGAQMSSGDSGTSMDDLPRPGCDSRQKICGPPVDCNIYSCGKLWSPYDEQGVRRPDCGSQHCCAPGFACFRPFDWTGGCVPSVWGCGFATDDCGGDFCVPESLGPPPYDCGTYDEAQCVAAGCTFVMAPYYDGFGGDCDCGPPMPQCLWFPVASESVEKPTAYYPDTGNDVRVFPREWSAPPFGWHLCAGDPDAPEGCDCIDKCVP